METVLILFFLVSIRMAAASLWHGTHRMLRHKAQDGRAAWWGALAEASLALVLIAAIIGTIWKGVER